MKIPEGWLAISHSSADGVAVVTKEAYESVWKKKGWKETSKKDIADAEEAEVDAVLNLETPADAGVGG